MFRAFADQMRDHCAVDLMGGKRRRQVAQHPVERNTKIVQCVNHGAIKVNNGGIDVKQVQVNRVQGFNLLRTEQAHNTQALVCPARFHIFLLYCPPTSNKAFVIWPREQQRTASISTSNTFLLSITAFCRRLSIAGASLACSAWKSARRFNWLCFSSSVERASSSVSCTASPCGLRKVLTPMMGSSPVCLSIS